MTAARLLVLAVLVLAAFGVALERRRRRWSTTLTGRIPGHHDHWRERGRRNPGSVLYVALGDSAALGLGASHPRRGYVGIVADEIAAITGTEVRVRNLAIDGATVATCLADELPRLPPRSPLVCTVDIGANDVWSVDLPRFRADFDRLCAALPSGAIVADVPSFSVVPIGGRVAAMNRVIHEVAGAHGLWVAPLNAVTAIGGPIDAFSGSSGDLFHPNDRGHRRWAEAFLPGVRARLAEAGYPSP